MMKDGEGLQKVACEKSFLNSCGNGNTRGTFNARPILLAAIAFAIAVFFALHSFEKVAFAVTAAVICSFGLLLVAAFSFKAKFLSALYALIALLFFAGGYCYAYFKVQALVTVPAYRESVEVEGKVVSVKDYGSAAVLVIENAVIKGEKTNGKIKVYLNDLNENSVRLPYAFERVRFNAELSRTGDLQNSLDYLKSGQSYYASFSGDMLIAGDDANVFEKVKRAASEFLKSCVDGGNYGVVLAMLLGDSSHTDEQTLGLFRSAGIAHVFAVSGLHIGLFASALGALCNILKIKGAKRAFWVLLPTLFYVGVCGFTSSSVRAFVMTAAIIFSSIFGVKHDGLSALAAAALVIIAVNPFAVFDMGFLLSFSAVGGITLLSRKLERGAAVLPKSLSGSISVCLAAQFGTLPLLTQMSGYISVIATFANLIFLPILSLIYQAFAVLTVLSLPFSLFGINAGGVLLFVPDALLSLITKVIAAVDYDVFAFKFSFGYSSVFYYAALVFASDVVNPRKVNKGVICAVSAALFVILSVAGV